MGSPLEIRPWQRPPPKTRNTRYRITMNNRLISLSALSRACASLASGTWGGGVFAWLTEHAREDLVDVLQLPLEVESALDLRARDAPGDLRIIHHQSMKVESLRPRPHGVRLHQTIGIFPRYSGFDQIEQQLPAE